MKKSVIAAIVGVASLVSFGASAATPSFDFLQGSYVNFDGPGVSIDGFGLSLEKTIHGGFFVEGMAIRLSENSINNTTSRLGAGYAHNLQQNQAIALYIVGGLSHDKTTGAGRWNDSESGQYAIVGVRASFNPNFEAGLSAERYWWDYSNGNNYVAQGRFFLNENLSLQGKYRYEDSDYSAYEIGVAYHF